MNLQKLKVAVATPKNSLKKFNHCQGSTTGAFQLTPVFYRELMPRAKIKCDQKDSVFFVRSLPMSVPTLVQYDFKFNRFFVPYIYIWPAWNDYKAGNLHYYPATGVNAVQSPDIPREKPWISQGNLTTILLDSFFSHPTGTGERTDFTAQTGNGFVGYTWTRMGLMAYKLLQNLGYQCCFDVGAKARVNILNIFAYGKIFLDWYYPSNYAFEDIDFYKIYQAFTTDLKVVEAGPTSPKNVVYYDAVRLILKMFTEIYFDNDVYYDMWDNPASPNNSGSIESVSILDSSNNKDYPMVVTNDITSPFIGTPVASDVKPSNGTPFIGGRKTSSSSSNSSPSGVITQFVIDALQKVSNFVRRYQLAGSSLVDRWLAYFGVNLPDSHRSIRLGETIVPLKVGDIAATSDSVNGTAGVNSVLGDLAGKGVALQHLGIDYENKQNTHGVYMILMSTNYDNWIVTGIDKHNLCINYDEDYLGEFDNLGTEAVQRQELYVSKDAQRNNDMTGTCGFLPRYYNRCLSRNIVSGAFNADSFGGEALRAWLPRKYFGSVVNQSDISHSLDFMHPQTYDLNQASQPFYDKEYVENFIYVCEFKNVTLIDAKKPLSDVYDWSEDEKNGMVDVNGNGVKVN